ncbi:MAG: succinate dehydrogenase, cytochrome b556 subunit [Sphingomonadales bacterium]
MRNPKRPLSPHLGVYRWQPHMLVSILHRMTGSALAVGALIFVWGLVAAATGPEAFAVFASVLGHPVGVVVMIGVTWALMQHLASGLRHLYMDTGKGFALGASRNTALATLAFSVLATALIWALICGII